LVDMTAHTNATPGPARTPRGQGDRLRERLLDAGLEIVSEHGHASHATIRAVTKQASVSPTAFYLHFPTRDDFLAALRQRGFAEFRAAIDEAAIGGGEDPPARFHAAGLGYMRFARERPNVYALIFGPDAPVEDGEPDPDAAGPAAFNDLVALIQACLADAGTPHPDVERLAMAVWSGLHGFVTLRNATSRLGWPTDEEFAAQLTDAWLGSAVRAGAGD
jgi:AcrR family transcriptional regulator